VLAAHSPEQLFDAGNQPLNRERLDQIFYIVLGQEQRDSCIRRKAGDEYEPIGQRRPHFLCLQIELVTTQARHLQVADYRVVFVRLDLEQGRSSIKGHINEKILVRQNPLQSRRQLLVVIAVIAMLIALLVPAVQRVREAAPSSPVVMPPATPHVRAAMPASISCRGAITG